MAGDGVGDRLRRRRSAEAFADDEGEQPLAVTAQVSAAVSAWLIAPR